MNGGHSAAMTLSSNPELSYHGVDVCDHAYVTPAVEWLAHDFPGRVTFTKGSSLGVLPELARQRLSFDAFHEDGYKRSITGTSSTAVAWRRGTGP